VTIALGDTVVAIPAYNSEPFIAEAICSALNQHPDVRVLVSDNASTDDTVRRIEELESDRVTIHRQQRNIGPQGNFNWLLENCTADVVSLFCADDVMLPGHLSTQVKILAADDAVKLVGCNMRATSADLTPQGLLRTARGSWWGPDLTALSFNTLYQLFGGPSNYVFRRCDVKETRFDITLPWLSDFDFASRLVGEGWFVNPGHTGYLYRRHPGTDSAGLRAADVHQASREWAEYILCHGGAAPRSIKALCTMVDDATLEQRLEDEWLRFNPVRRNFCGPFFLSRATRRMATSRAGRYFMKGSGPNEP
jgi:glycosyltransferase involved in cell wall biosynthesis